ncbi:hypothetical protein MKW94_012018 [Papaver nudicaule]|uniref:Uncharacterized protein n=1 Tax=Papaver nudicaule TaxID=74823 RepID=A0AA41SM35_PAPNU|nr:hypothetical protein [Papaver nudicaule]
MDSDDDYQSFLPTEENPSPVRQRKLKRLKKSASIPSQPIDENPSKKSNISSSETLDIIQPVNPTPSVLVDPEGFDQDEDSIKTLDTLDSVDPVPSALVPDGIDQGDSVKPLGITESVDPETETPDEMESVDPIQPVLESESIEQGSDSIEEFVVKESDLINELRAEMGMVKTEKRSEKKRRSSSEGVEEMKDKTKKKKKKDEKDVSEKEEIPKAPVPTKRQLEKERKIHLELLHAETQRLLRESRDAEFKPVPIVQKPISSILAKIRQRKLEVSKKASSLSIYYADSNDSLEVNKLDYSDKHAQSADRGEEKHPEEFQEKDAPLIYEKSNHLDAVNVDTLSEPASSSFQHESYVANTVLDEESKSACVNPQKDAQDVLLGSQPRHMEDGEDEESKSACPTPKKNTEEISLGSQPREEEDAPADSQLDSPIGEVLAPSLLTMQLRLDAAQPNETSSGEEESDKENVEPDPRKLDDLDSNLDTIGDPVKAFLDDEAEEEDDSDDDLAQFKDDEDEEEDELNEELKDLIAYGYEEKPVDNEKRDQLHQMWLQQQDAAETDNVLQRLRCGANQKGPSMLEEEEEEDEEEEDDEPGDDLVDHQSSKNIVRMISKKAKQMIPEMFTNKDDTFLSSDDEETDQKIVRQRLLEKAVEDSSLLPPAVDESSSEVFGLIRKLNVAPDTKKKAKPSSIFDAFITGGNSNSSSKFSFLGRASSNSLPASTKHVSSNVRSFIFGRDDSNSRSGISTSEVSLDMGELEKRAPRNASAKFSGSQTKSSTQSTVVTETSRTGSSSSSLLEVLRRSSSMQSDHHTRNINMVGQTQACFQFAAFKPGKIAALKPGKKPLKVEGKT